ncbi:MAG: cytochrome ubiquinol oxidase subunit I [Desulfovibrionaceae bacterium]|nr:cytochrome ubiquinol oxidase subunit I [Desulfovibrionaceae bacterium]
MDVVLLSRLQFAIAVFFHFIFVPLTLGMTVLLAIMETAYVRTGKEIWKRAVRFWGKLFLINFTLGVVTGISLVFQFGMNWSRYSAFVGDIFGSLLAIEATVAFFLESVFVAVWAFGWNRISRKAHLVAIWLVALASNTSALWIILANGWMQNPVGYVLRNGRAELESFGSVFFNGFAWGQYSHTIFSSWMLSGFFILGISAWHLLRGNETEFFKKSVKVAAPFTLILALLLGMTGHKHAVDVALHQPMKLAAMESHWDTAKNVPMYLLVVPDPDNSTNLVEAFPVPDMLSMLVGGSGDTEVKGLKEVAPDLRPPVTPTFLSFRFMAGCGVLFILLAFLAWRHRRDLEQCPRLMKCLVYCIPLPYIAIMAGWAVAEIGRQPWIVYGLMKTSDAASPVPSYSVFFSILALIVIYGFLGTLDIALLRKYAKRGPDPRN